MKPAAIAGALCLLSWNVGSTPARAQDASGAVAKVGRFEVKRSEFEARVKLAHTTYKQRTGEDIPPAMEPMLKRSVLEQLIRANLLMLEAERRGLLVSDQEAEEELKRSPFFNEGGVFSSTKYQSFKLTDPVAFRNALELTRLHMSGARMSDRVDREHAPEEAKIRARIERELTAANLEYLAIPFETFAGAEPQPSELDVVEYYRKHRNGFTKPGAAGGAPAPLREVAPEIRERLRKNLSGREQTLRSLYARDVDSLVTPAARVRYALFETAKMKIDEPAAKDLDHFYRTHLPDYSVFDATKGEVRQRPLEEVRDDVTRRVRTERLQAAARAGGAALLEAWQRGRTDRRAERVATVLRESALVPLGAPLDTFAIGRMLGDTLEVRDGQPGFGSLMLPRGLLVFQIFDRDAAYTPTFEQARPKLEALLTDQRKRAEREGARALYASDPQRFATGPIVHFTRIVVPYPDPIDVPLTRAEVEKFHREHIDRYAAPEVAAARQILVAPTAPGAAADAAARVKAQGILQRIRDGEDFADLARRFSDDAKTRESGGDMGSFGRGVLAPALDRAVFSMRAGDVSDLIKTSEGYHILKCTAYEAAQARDLIKNYTNVGFDAAQAKGVGMSRESADSLFRHLKSPKQALEIAKTRQLAIYRNAREVGGPVPGGSGLEDYLRALDDLKPGQFYPGVEELKGQGFMITWIDSLTAPVVPPFEAVETQVTADYRRQVGRRAVEGKVKELQALAAQGWSFDSLAALFGGVGRMEQAQAGSEIPNLGGADVLDSLVFGAGRRPVLAEGDASDWVTFPDGVARVRVVKVFRPGADQVASRLERERRKALEHELYYYFEDLKRRFPVRILDSQMAALSMPPPKLPGEP